MGNNPEPNDIQDTESVFTDFLVHDDLQKLYEFADHMHDPNARHMAGCEAILKALQAFEGKARQAGIDPETESRVSTALRAVLELERLIKDGASPVINDEEVVRIFIQSLEADLEALQEHERHLNAGPGSARSRSSGR